MSEATISLSSPKGLVALFGPRDQYLRQVRDALGVKVVVRNSQIHIEGTDEQVTHATEVFARLRHLLREQGSLSPVEVNRVIDSVVLGDLALPHQPIEVLGPGKQIRPRTEGQGRYVEAIRKNELTLCVGPAGTGKTYLAVAMAVNALRTELIKKIVLVRPAVEAGEKLGFLPGDIEAKVNPYLRPLLDALHDMMHYDQIRRYMDSDLIEIIPLAYMRGRTLNESFIILDEGQNTTVPQMKMFLTRLGMGSRIIVTGDITQIDLPAHTRSGLIDALERLRDIPSIATVELTKSDIVRHHLVTQIVRAYEQGEKKKGRRAGRKKG
ncbi:MAG: PhoH family protein [Pirellulales bacterium]